MAYSQLMSARSDYSSFGNSLASIQENAQDVQSSNDQSNLFYQSLSNQMETAGLMEGIPSIPAIVGSAYNIYKSVKTIGSLKETVTNAAKDAADLAKSKLGELKGVGDKFVTQAQEGVADIKNTISTAVDNVQNSATGLYETAQGSAAGIINDAKTALDTNVTAATDLAKSKIGELKDVGDKFVVQAQEGAADIKNTISAAADNVQNSATGLYETAQGSAAGIINDAKSALETTVTTAQEAGSGIISNISDSGAQIAQSASNSVRAGSQDLVSNISTTVSENISNSVASSSQAFVKKSTSTFKSAGESELPSGETTAQSAIGGTELGEDVNSVLHTYSGFTQSLKPNFSFGNLFGSSKPPTMTGFNSAPIAQEASSISENISGASQTLVNKFSTSTFKNVGQTELPSGETTAQAAIGGAELGEDVDTVLHTYSGFTQALKPKFSFGNLFGSSKPPTMTGFNSAPIAQEASAVSENISGAAQNLASQAGKSVETTLASTQNAIENIAGKAGTVAENIVGEGANIAGKVGETVSGLASTASEGLSAGTDLAIGLSDIALPVVGEIGLAGLGIYTAVTAFKDLFSHPSQPTAAPVPIVSNISQSFQSGI